MRLILKPFYLTTAICLMCLIALPSCSSAGIRKVKPSVSVAYGNYQAQTMDVYLPAKANNAPVILMVHGGAWKIGDKGAKSVVKHKVKRWVEKGFIFISINYRLMPEAKPLAQANDVRAVLAFAQNKASTWGGDGSKFILMGHSAGAHLVSLVTSTPALNNQKGIQPWLGTVSIDSAAFDIVEIMRGSKPPRFYQQAFGDKPAYWRAASPLHMLKEKSVPILAICSTQRKDGSCDQAQRYLSKAKGFGTEAQVLPVDLSHRKANSALGQRNAYTDAVETFLKTLDSDAARLLGAR